MNVAKSFGVPIIAAAPNFAKQARISVEFRPWLIALLSVCRFRSIADSHSDAPRFIASAETV
jgi:hypothetical protein